jgi:glycosyltransferase involved in cell wall biosynthesis
MKLVITIPAFNESRSIEGVIRGIPKNFQGIDCVQILVVDDGSTDNTSELARNAGAKVLSHIKNLGLGLAFSDAVKGSLLLGADIMVVIDADGQYAGMDIENIIRPIIDKRADFVSGSRFLNGAIPSMPKIKFLGNKIMAGAISFVCGRKFSDISCGFRAYSREALLNLNIFGGFTYTQEVILNLYFKYFTMFEVPVGVKYFSVRKSHITGNLPRYILNTIKIIIRTIIDYAPFRVIGGFGFIVFLTGLILDLILLYFFLQTGKFSPNVSVGILGLSFNAFGFLLIIIGLLAEMLYRVRQNQERILYYQKKEYYDREK